MIEVNFTPFPVLVTDRLVLRQLEITDDKDTFRLRSDERVNKYLEGFEHTNIEQTRAFIGKIIDNKSTFWVITLNDTHQFIGTICLWNFSEEEQKAETGYTLDPDFQGKGYMKESLDKVIDYGFNQMKLRTIEAYTHRDNSSSINLLLKSMFKQDVTREMPTGSHDIVFVLENKNRE